MLGAAIIVFREAIEAGLIIGIAMAATRGVMGRGAYILGGVGGGLLGACCVALFAARLSAALDGNGQEYFNAAILLAASKANTSEPIPVHNEMCTVMWCSADGTE